ncbi:undecaprenyl-diphosphate phosphatase [Candidatus Microgenomates bacterium]|nr:undecaprenyl-diphosphate phosphatase [Candidatus Microgenomates bacterium]
MTLFQALILSLVEGITEFLPISSTGHLILAGKLLNIPQTEFVKSFEIIIQLGAILAVVFIYFPTLKKDFHLWKKILVAFIPTGIFGFLLYKIVKKFLLGNLTIVVISLFLGGILMLVLEKIFQSQKDKVVKLNQLNYPKAGLIGLIQSISMIPGVSRSAATIFGGMSVGLERKTAVEFSFLLAIPTMLAATGLDLVKTGFQFQGNEYLLLGVGFTGAFFSALAAVKYLLKYIQNHNFVYFAVYRIVLAIAFLPFL